MARSPRHGGVFVMTILLLLTGLVPTTSVLGQTEEQVDRYRLAQNYTRAGQFDRAITLLEDLHDEDPAAHVFYEKLKEAYEQSKRYDEAIALVETRLEEQRTPVMMADKARLLYLKGDEQQAFSTYDAAVAMAPDRRATYLTVYHSLTQNRLFTHAADILEEARQHLGDEEAFQSALAQLYSLTGEHERAMHEYAGWLRTDAGKLGLIRGRLNQFADSEEALEAYIAVLRQAVREEPLFRPYRDLLSWLYLEDEQYREALDVTRAIDRLEDEQGETLFAFGQRASHAGAYDVALEAFQDILNRHPDAPVAPQALLGLGRMHEAWAEQQNERAFDIHGERIEAPHYEAALEAYQSFLQQYPGNGDAASVLRRIGRLQQDVFRKLEEAEITLNEVANRYPDSQAAERARYDLGRVALQRGQLSDARLAFSRLAEALHTGELADQARYEMALLHFYDGAFESALSLVDVLDANTSTDVANDAITLKVLIQENRGPDSLNVPLQQYATARLLQRQRHPQQAIDTLEALLEQHGRHPIADDVRFLRAQALSESGAANDAVSAYLELPLIHPGSALADRSLVEAARLQEHVLDKPAAAVETYTRLLSDHPGSLLIPDARARIRALRDAAGGAPAG